MNPYPDVLVIDTTHLIIHALSLPTMHCSLVIIIITTIINCISYDDYSQGKKIDNKRDNIWITVFDAEEGECFAGGLKVIKIINIAGQSQNNMNQSTLQTNHQRQLLLYRDYKNKEREYKK